ncbi:MAG: translocation/assembly module TamB domain-containing protein [Rhodothermales bacterium]
MPPGSARNIDQVVRRLIRGLPGWGMLVLMVGTAWPASAQAARFPVNAETIVRGQDDLNLYRSIEVVPDRSIIRQFGRNFRITEGVASFNGPVEEMQMQIEAEYEVPSRLNPGQPEVVITLRLDGRLDDLAFNLSSDPAMENTDIVSYIATGRPASESLQFGGTDFNNQVLVGVAASQLAGLVEGVASQSLGLDVVSIEQDGLKGTRLTAGKYVTPRLFVGVTHPLTLSNESTAFEHDERELTLEYKVLEYLLLQLLADSSDSPVRLNLAGRYAY